MGELPSGFDPGNAQISERQRRLDPASNEFIRKPEGQIRYIRLNRGNGSTNDHAAVEVSVGGDSAGTAEATFRAAPSGSLDTPVFDGLTQGIQGANGAHQIEMIDPQLVGSSVGSGE